MRNIWKLICFVVTVGAALAGNPPVDISEIANITGYPAVKLTVTDSTEFANRTALRKNTAQCLLSVTYTGEGNTFAPLNVIVGKRGTLLTGELEKHLKLAAQQPGTGSRVRYFSPRPGVYGFVGVSRFGAGGSMDRGIVSFSESDRDIQVTISIGEDGLESLAGAENYQKLMLTPEGMTSVIEKCLTKAGENLIAGGRKGPNGEDAASPVDPAGGQLQQEKDKPGDSGAGGNVWLYVLGAAAVLLLVAAVVCRTTRKNMTN